MDSKLVLFRSGCNSRQEDQEELAAIQQAGFNGIKYLTAVTPNSLVIPRYSLFPWYQETIQDIAHGGGKTINSAADVDYILNFSSWVEDLGDLTPLTWDHPINVPFGEGPYMVRGNLSSRKNSWGKYMFGTTREDIIKAYNLLSDDSGFQNQKLYIRKWEELVCHGTNIIGFPISHEFRFFVYNKRIMAGGYYWANHVEEIGFTPDIASVPQKFLDEVLDKINVPFYAMDVAQKKTGQWTVVELNLGEQAGLCGVSATELYQNLMIYT